MGSQQLFVDPVWSVSLDSFAKKILNLIKKIVMPFLEKI